MPLSVGSSATKSSSLHSSRERQHYASLRNHPYQRSLSNQGSSTSHRETHSRRTSLSANDCHCFLATVGDLCVARPNEDPLEYASRVAARDAKAQDYEVIFPSFSSHINPVTHLSYHELEWATKIDTPAHFQSSPLPFANCGLPFVFAATVAYVGPHVQPDRTSPLSSPIQPMLAANVQANVERTDRERLAQKLNEHLETHPEPIVGSIDNPFPFADKYGIRGVSILSVFFEHLGMGTFTCHFCNDKRSTIDDALEHQRIARHYSE